LKTDEKNRVIYFLANGREKGRDPYFSHLYRVDFNGKNLQLLTPEDANHNVSLSPDGKYFATGSRDKMVKIWEAESVQLLLRINKEKQDGHLNSVNKVLWTEDGLVSTGDDRLIILWKIVAQ
jgi:WD40 repeat protein